MRRSIVTLAFLVSLLLPVMTAPSYAVATDPISATNAAISWLRTQQQADGSFPGFGPGDQGFDPIFAFAAAGIDAHSVARPGGQSLVSFAQGPQARAYATGSAASAAKAILASVATDEDPHAFGGIDLVATLVNTYTTTTGAYGNSGAFGQSLAILALHAAGEHLLRRQSNIWSGFRPLMAAGSTTPVFSLIPTPQRSRSKRWSSPVHQILMRS